MTVTKSLKLGQGVLSMVRAVTLEPRKASVRIMRSPSAFFLEQHAPSAEPLATPGEPAPPRLSQWLAKVFLSP